MQTHSNTQDGAGDISKGSARQLYARTAPYYDLCHAPAEGDEAGFLADVLQEAGGRRGDRVLDVGPGTGRIAFAMARREAHVVAAEPSEAMRTVLLARLGVLSEIAERVTVLTDAAAELALGETFPLAYALNVMLLVPGRDERLASLRAMRKHLAPRGRAVVNFAAQTPETERPEAKVAERRLGDVLYEQFSGRSARGDRLWEVRWRFRVSHRDRVVDEVRETFTVRGDDVGSATALMEDAGFEVLRVCKDFGGRAATDAEPGRLIFVAAAR